MFKHGKFCIYICSIFPPVTWKVDNFLLDFLVFDASFSVALWGLSLTCALVMREFEQMMGHTWDILEP